MSHILYNKINILTSEGQMDFDEANLYIPNNTRSDVWRFFRCSRNRPDYAVCILCRTWLAYKGGNTSVFRNHIRAKHEEQSIELGMSSIRGNSTCHSTQNQWKSFPTITKSEASNHLTEDEKLTSVDQLAVPERNPKLLCSSSFSQEESPFHWSSEAKMIVTGPPPEGWNSVVPQRSRSEAWLWFYFSDSHPNKAMCRICFQQVSFRDRCSNLYNHIKQRHEKVLGCVPVISTELHINNAQLFDPGSEIVPSIRDHPISGSQVTTHSSNVVANSVFSDHFSISQAIPCTSSGIATALSFDQSPVLLNTCRIDPSTTSNQVNQQLIPKDSTLFSSELESQSHDIGQTISPDLIHPSVQCMIKDGTLRLPSHCNSRVWECFRIESCKNRRAICLACGASLRYSGGTTSTLWNHCRARHMDIFNLINSNHLKDKQESATKERYLQFQQTRSQQDSQDKSKTPNESKIQEYDRFISTKALTDFIGNLLQKKMPLSIALSPAINKLVTTLTNSHKAPSLSWKDILLEIHSQHVKYESTTRLHLQETKRALDLLNRPHFSGDVQSSSDKVMEDMHCSLIIEYIPISHYLSQPLQINQVNKDANLLSSNVAQGQPHILMNSHEHSEQATTLDNSCGPQVKGSESSGFKPSTESTLHGFLSVTFAYVDESFVRHSILVALVPITNREVRHIFFSKYESSDQFCHLDAPVIKTTVQMILTNLDALGIVLPKNVIIVSDSSLAIVPLLVSELYIEPHFLNTIGPISDDIPSHLQNLPLSDSSLQILSTYHTLKQRVSESLSARPTVSQFLSRCDVELMRLLRQSTVFSSSNQSFAYSPQLQQFSFHLPELGVLSQLQLVASHTPDTLKTFSLNDWGQVEQFMNQLQPIEDVLSILHTTDHITLAHTHFILFSLLESYIGEEQNPNDVVNLHLCSTIHTKHSNFCSTELSSQSTHNQAQSETQSETQDSLLVPSGAVCNPDQEMTTDIKLILQDVCLSCIADLHSKQTILAYILDPRLKNDIQEKMNESTESLAKAFVLQIISDRAEFQSNVQSNEASYNYQKEDDKDTLAQIVPSLPLNPSSETSSQHLSQQEPQSKRRKVENMNISAMSHLSTQENNFLFKAIKEIEEYLHLPTIELNDNPLTWWFEHQQHFPMLSLVAKQYLAIPSTSSYASCTLQNAKDVITDILSKWPHIRHFVYLHSDSDSDSSIRNFQCALFYTSSLIFHTSNEPTDSQKETSNVSEVNSTNSIGLNQAINHTNQPNMLASSQTWANTSSSTINASFILPKNVPISVENSTQRSDITTGIQPASNINYTVFNPSMLNFPQYITRTHNGSIDQSPEISTFSGYDSRMDTTDISDAQSTVPNPTIHCQVDPNTTLTVIHSKPIIQ